MFLIMLHWVFGWATATRPYENANNPKVFFDEIANHIEERLESIHHELRWGGGDEAIENHLTDFATWLESQLKHIDWLLNKVGSVSGKITYPIVTQLSLSIDLLVGIPHVPQMVAISAQLRQMIRRLSRSKVS